MKKIVVCLFVIILILSTSCANKDSGLTNTDNLVNTYKTELYYSTMQGGSSEIPFSEEIKNYELHNETFAYHNSERPQSLTVSFLGESYSGEYSESVRTKTLEYHSYNGDNFEFDVDGENNIVCFSFYDYGDENEKLTRDECLILADNYLDAICEDSSLYKLEYDMKVINTYRFVYAFCDNEVMISNITICISSYGKLTDVINRNQKEYTFYKNHDIDFEKALEIADNEVTSKINKAGSYYLGPCSAVLNVDTEGKMFIACTYGVSSEPVTEDVQDYDFFIVAEVSSGE